MCFYSRVEISNDRKQYSVCMQQRRHPSEATRPVGDVYLNCTHRVSRALQTSGGDVAQLVECQTGTPPTQVRFPGAARDFSPRVTFQCRLSYDVRTPPCAIACMYICALVKDPEVHVRVRWIMETLKHTACTVGWVLSLIHI